MEERNALGQVIYSTHLTADVNEYVTEVEFPSNIRAFYEYKVTFPELRDPNSLQVQFSELELPGTQLYLGNDGGTKERAREIETYFSYSDECMGDSFDVIQGLSRQGCAQACIDIGSSCEGFDYATVLVENGGLYIEPGDCLLPVSTPSVVSNFLLAGQNLYAGEYLQTRQGQRAKVELNGQLCVYGNTDYLVPVWCTDTVPQPTGTAYLRNQFDRNLVLYGESGAYWATGTGTGTGSGPTANFVIQPDGNLVYYDGSTALWACGSKIGAGGNTCPVASCSPDCTNPLISRAPTGSPTVASTGTCDNDIFQMEHFARVEEQPGNDPFDLASTTSFGYAYACVEDITVTYEGKTREECRQLCVDYGSDCLAAAYFTKSDTVGRCGIAGSRTSSTCDNSQHHIELYERIGYEDVPTDAPTPVPLPSYTPTVSPNTDAPTAPTFVVTLRDKLEPAAGTDLDHFGMSIDMDISSNVTIVGAPHEDTDGVINAGAAYIFALSEDGVSWTQLIRVRPNDPTTDAQFGHSVAIFGQTAVVGAYSGGKGAAYVFSQVGDDGPWVQQAKLEPSDGEDGDRFGISVDIFEDMVVVGADNFNTTDCGAVYMFTREMLNWNEVLQIKPSDCVSGLHFGHSVSLEPNTANHMIIGAYGDSTNGDLSGSAYVYSQNATNSTFEWSLEAKLFAFDGEAGDSFGISAAISGGNAIVGAYLDDTEFGGQNVGSAYIFSLHGGVWTNSTKLEHSDGLAGDGFGTSVAIDREVAVVGAPEADLDGDTSGSAYVFVQDQESGNWEQLRKIQGTGIKAQMGRAVAVQDNFFMASASHESVEVPSGETVALANERGSSYIYKISSPDLFQPTASPTTSAPTVNATASPTNGPSGSPSNDPTVAGGGQ